MATAIEERVRRLLRDFQEDGETSALGPLTRWLELVASWNAKMDLTAARTSDELVDLMVADALVLAAGVPRGRRVVDVGSGAGAPGLALGILRPDLEMVLVEPLQKRVAFLRTTVGTLAQEGAFQDKPMRVERARGEDLVRRGEVFDVAISRATLAPEAWLALGAALTGAERDRAAGSARPTSGREARGRAELEAAPSEHRGSEGDLEQALQKPADGPQPQTETGSSARRLADGSTAQREVWVLLAREPPPARAGLEIAQDRRYRWPLTGAERRAVRFVHADRDETSSGSG